MGGGPAKVDLLILGKGWTANYLIPLLSTSPSPISYAATTRDGKDGTIPFTFSPDSSDTAPYAALPDAQVVLITFPLTGDAQPGKLVGGYEATRHHDGGRATKWVFLGATSTWSQEGLTTPDSPWDRGNARARAEEALLEIKGGDAVVPCLAGLWGGERQPRKFARRGRLARTKEDVRKRGAVHFVHGEDVARGLRVVVEKGVERGEGWKGLGGKRWIVSDLRCYDWWDLLSSWDAAVNEEVDKVQGERVEYAKWVGELMLDEGVAVLPREPKLLGRVLDGRGWWKELGVWPGVERLA